MKPAGQSFFQHIPPEAACAIGPVAGLETRLDCRDELGVMDLADADRTAEPGVKSRTGHSQDLAQPADGPDVAVLGDDGEPHITSRAKKSATLFEACHAPPGAGRPLSSEPKSRPDRPASARSGKRYGRRGCQLSHPPPQHALPHIEVTRGLRHSDPPIRHQPDGFDLELTTELPSGHIHSPVPWSRSYLRVHETSSSLG